MTHFNFFGLVCWASILVHSPTFSASENSWSEQADFFWRQQYLQQCAQNLKSSISQKVEVFHARDCRLIKKNTSCIFMPVGCAQILEKKLTPLKYDSPYLFLIPEPWYVYASSAALACRRVKTAAFSCDYIGVIRNRVETSLFFRPPFTFGIKHKVALRYAFNPEAVASTRLIVNQINNVAQNKSIAPKVRENKINILKNQIIALLNGGLIQQQQRQIESELYYARQAIIDFYKKHHIFLDLEFVLGWPNRTPQLAYQKGLSWDANLFPKEKKMNNSQEPFNQMVNVFYDEDVSKADEWHLKGPNYTKTATHEISHKFGLQDEYAAAEYCPLYQAREPNSLMAASYYSETLTEKVLYLRHIQEIFKYICDPYCRDQRFLDLCQDYQQRF